MTRYDVLLAITDTKRFSELCYAMVEKAETEQDFHQVITKELTESELQAIQSVAQSDYPLSL